MAKRNKNMSRAAHREDAAHVAENQQHVEEAARKSLGYFLITVVVVVVFGIFLMVRHKGQSADAAEAAAAYQSLDQPFIEGWQSFMPQSVEGEAAEARRDALAKVSADHAGTQAAAEAGFYTASLLYSEGNYADAAKAYAAFYTDHGSDLPRLAGWARLGEANALAAQGKFAEAMPKYDDAANPLLLGEGSTVQPFAQLMGAACAIEIGELDKARNLLDSVLGNVEQAGPLQDQARLLRTRIDLVGAQLASADGTSRQTLPADGRPVIEQNIRGTNVVPGAVDHDHDGDGIQDH